MLKYLLKYLLKEGVKQEEKNKDKMTYIKKLHLHGFKSFAKPTEILFEKGMNVIVGPNGSGKSNIIDSICFVLGRSRMKSLRASRAANLIYNGGKEHKPGSSAKVSIIFDNEKNIFSLPHKEIEVSRTVKKNGTSIYKINNETKTRQEIRELLAEAGIDSEGFNIILQAEINGIISMHPEEKRQIIEEIAGISIYEVRKEKSLRELEKTEEKLKQIGTVLNERNAYLRNLEKERNQALRYDSLKRSLTRYKASVLYNRINEKRKFSDKIKQDIEKKKKEFEKIKSNIEKNNSEIENLKEKAREIEKRIQKETGIEQETLRETISNIKTEISSLEIKKENFISQIDSLERREKTLKESIKESLGEIESMERAGTEEISISEKDKYNQINSEISKQKAKIGEFESKKEKYHISKTEIAGKEALIPQYKRNLIKLDEEKLKLTKIIRDLEYDLKRSRIDVEENAREKRGEHERKINKIKQEIFSIEKDLVELLTRKDIHKANIEKITKLNECPTCKQIVTKEYKESLNRELKELILGIEKDFKEKSKTKDGFAKEVDKIAQVIAKFLEKEKNLQKSLALKENLQEHKSKLEKLQDEYNETEQEIEQLKKEITSLKRGLPNLESIEEKIAENRIILEKLKEDMLKVNTSIKKADLEKEMSINIELKKRDVDRMEANIKSGKREKLELESELKEIQKEIKLKRDIFSKKNTEKEIVEKKYKKQLNQKDEITKQILENENNIRDFQNKKMNVENEINNYNIEIAKYGAEISTLNLDFKEYEGIEIVKMKIEELQNRIEKTTEELEKIGNVNLRALEVYDRIKKEYEEIESKADKLEEEKQAILKIIAEVDRKKKQTFMQTFNLINNSFSENFLSLSDKGHAYLDLEDQKDPFNAGMHIVIKLAKGKYMDAEALSGGERVIVALALMFAIQKYKPYNFYLFDEIDPALDKRNSERLAKILKENIKDSQCIIVTHNDAITESANTLYGIAMDRGISKTIGLKV